MAKINTTLELINELVLNTICKEEIRAARLDYQNPEAQAQFMLYNNAILRIDNIYDYQFTVAEIRVYAPHVTVAQAQDIINGKAKFEDYISKEMIEYMLETKRLDRINSFEELNDYYRMLNGLPPYGTKPEDYVLVDGVPIHTLSSVEILKLKASGRLDVIVGENKDKKYLFYLDKKTSSLVARKAESFTILYTPDDSKFTKYRECYNKCRKEYLLTFGNKYLTRSTDYNEVIELLMIKLQAVIWFFIEMYDPSIDKNNWTKEEAQDKWEENGLTLPQDMPDEYTNAITFVLDYLIYYKGTNFVVKYITEKIFSGLNLYKYIIVKRSKPGLDFSKLPPDTKDIDKYDVSFVLVPFDDFNHVDISEKKLPYRELSYDDVVRLDPRWPDSQSLKEAVFSDRFSYIDSKYLALNNFIDLIKFSNELGIIERVFIERKALLNRVYVSYATSGTQHTFFNFFIFFMDLFTRILNKFEVVAPDTMIKYKSAKFLGFFVPSDVDRIKVKFLDYFSQKGFNDFVNKFPDALNDNQSFIDLLVNIDKAMGITEMFYEIFLSCETIAEFDCINAIYKEIRLRDPYPQAYNMSMGTIDGKTYNKYLLENDTDLAYLVEKAVQDETGRTLIMEFDNTVIAMIRILESQATMGEDIEQIKRVFSDANIYINGVSKYLLYILKIFKAYTADFLTEENIYEIDENKNYFLQIHELEIDYKRNVLERYNLSKYDFPVLHENEEEIEIIGMSTSDKVFLSLPHGETDYSKK